MNLIFSASIKAVRPKSSWIILLYHYFFGQKVIQPIRGLASSNLQGKIISFYYWESLDQTNFILSGFILTPYMLEDIGIEPGPGAPLRSITPKPDNYSGKKYLDGNNAFVNV